MRTCNLVTVPSHRNLLLLVCAFITMLAGAAPAMAACGCPEKVWELTWHRHDNLTTSDATIGGWHSTGTSRLQSDDDGAGSDDVEACAELKKNGATDTGWTYTGGDEFVDNSTELAALRSGQTKDVAIVKTSWDGRNGSTNTSTGKIALFVDDSLFNAITLGHEVGHKAGLGHVSLSRNIMTPSNTAETIDGAGGAAARNRVTQSQADKYEGL